jgi:methylated-DNA-[protein]-cysteine S-methyltransferase
MPALSTETRFGRLTIREEDGRIVALQWSGADEGAATDLLRDAVDQLRAYDSGRLQVFDLPLQVRGSAFQQAVCAQMQAIAFGDTRSYGEIAQALGQSAQAVGRACGANPIPILIPCHRVMGAGGRLTGFSGAGGVETKVALLRHEGAAGLLI